MSDSLSELFSDDVEPVVETPSRKLGFDYKGDDAALDDMVVEEGTNLTKPWMKFHRFKLVTSAEELRGLVNRAIEVGRVALDLETQGFDNRIEFREDGSFHTVHQIVGYCLGLEGEGYYIPVRHIPNLTTDPNPNIDSVELAEAEIKRLCEASQPVLKDGSIDILGAKEKDFEIPPRVVIEFWHAKFDQEFLYPVTGIDIWNPLSFEDGMLMVYTLCTEDEQGLKENARQRLKPQVDPKTGEEYPYEMIEFKELFSSSLKGAQRKFQKLVPRDCMPGLNIVLYGCSDGICTNLLCKDLKPEVAADKTQLGFYTLEKQVAQVVRIIERTRVLLNKGEIGTLLEEAERELKECEDQIRARAIAVGFPPDFNPSSSAQLADFLFGPDGIWTGKKPEKTAEGQYKTDEKTIEQFAKEAGAPEAFGLIIKHRQINKVRGTYLQNLANNTDELNQLRLNFRQTGAATGRFTAPKGDADHGYAGVPIQGIPARDDPKKPKVAHSLRRLFIARDGYIIVKADYASQELRIAASTSGEQKWIAEYDQEIATGKPADLHFLTAQAFYPGLTTSSPDYKLKRNSGKCVHPDTLVSSLGYAPLGAIAAFPPNADEFMDVVDIEVDGHPVAQTYNGGIKPLVHVVARKGILTCTPEHRFMRADGELVRAGDLRKGDELAPVELPSFWAPGPRVAKFKLWKGVPEATYKLDADLCYFAGVFLGDGSVSASSAKITHGSIEKLDAFDCAYLEWQRLLLDACRRIGMEAEPAADTVYLGSRVTVRYLASLGLVVPRPGTADGRKKNLRVPNWVLNQGPRGFLAFLGGLIDTDGSVSHQKRTIEFTTKDFIFGGQIAAMAQACGLFLSVEATYNKTYERHYVRLRFSVESSWKLRAYLRYPGKINRLAPAVYSSKMPDENDVLMVIPAGDGPCLDITMATDEHLYRANGMLTHNTANFALIYGGGVGAVQRATGCDKVEGTRLKKAFDDSVPGFSRWVKNQHKRVKEDLGVYTAFKRFISIPDANIDREEVIRRWRNQEKKFSESEVAQEVKKIRSACERKATNYPIQGAGADILKISLVLLLREFHLRGWLKNGGDDSVRIIMTVHDEIVFEVRKERVADALPVIVSIMESPSRMLSSWKVPLVAEADLGPSWAAKISWSGVLKGEVPPPDYLVGKTLTRDPDVLVLRKKGSASQLPPPAAPSAGAPPPTPIIAPPVASAPSLQAEPVKPKAAPAPAVSIAANGNGRSKKVASIRLKSAYIDRDTACTIALACMSANVEAQKLRKLDERLTVEFLAGGERPVLLYSAKHNYRVYVPELEGNLRRMSLLDDCVIREEAHG